MSEGGSGRVQKMDLTTLAVTTHATGFPVSTHHFSGQLVRTPAGRLFVLWGQNTVNKGLFEITNAGAVNLSAPRTAANAFRVDINQLAADSANNIYFAGNGTSAVWSSAPSGTTNYTATTKFADGVPEAEALAYYPRPATTLLVLTASASLTEAFPDGTVTYTLVGENAGGTAASNVLLQFPIPANTTFVSASSGGSVVGNDVRWTFASLGSGATATHTVTLRNTASPGSTIASVTATLTGGGSTASSQTAAIPVVAPPQLSLTLAVSATSAPSNSYLTYTIGYANTGGSNAVAAKIRNTIPSDTAFSFASGNGSLVSGAAEWILGTLAPGASGTVTFIVRISATSGSVNNNACQLSATGLTAIAAAAVATTITPNARLAVTVLPSPSPVIPETQINTSVTVTNTASTAATNVVVTAPLPADAELLSVTAGGVLSDGVVTWTFSTLAATSGSAKVRYSFRMNAEPGRYPLSGTVRSNQVPNSLAGAPGVLEVHPLPAAFVPGTLLTTESYHATDPNRLHVNYFNGTTFVQYADPPAEQWLGALHIAPNRRLYVGSSAGSPGSIYDVTVGGNLLNATPFVTGVGAGASGLTSDPDGNLYELSLNVARVFRITPEGEATAISPSVNGGGGVLWVDGFLYYSEAGTGTVWKMNLSTGTRVAHATGFPKAPNHFSGQLIRNQQGRIYVLWANGNIDSDSGMLGLFDITEPFTWTSSKVPVTAKGAFRGDSNQMFLAPDNSIWFAGNGSDKVWRAPWVNDTYGPTVPVANDAGDNEGITLVPELPLTMAGSVSPLRALSGDELTYTLNYANTSDDDVSGAYVEARVPAGAQVVSVADGGVLQDGVIRWTVGDFAAGQSGSFSFAVKITAIEGSTITLQGYFIDSDETMPTMGNFVVVPVERPLAIDASANPNPVLIGEQSTIQLRYENLNANAATNVTIHATLPPGCVFESVTHGGAFANGVITWTFASVAAGGEGDVSFVARAAALPAIVLSDYSVTTSELGTRAGNPLTIDVLPLPFDLGVRATASPDPVTSGDDLTYTITYTNDGGSTAPQTELRSAIPANTTFIRADGGTVEGTDVVWPVGALAAGASDSVTFTVRVDATMGTIINDTYAIASGTQTRPGAPVIVAVVAPPPPPPVAVSMMAEPSPVTSGELLTYTIIASNPDDDAAENIVVTTTLPAGASFVSATGGGTLNEDTVQWTVGTLDPAASSTLAFTVRVTALAGGVIVNSGATASAADRPAAASGQVSTSVIDPPSTLRLSIDAPDSVTPSQNITYTLTFNNDGPDTVTNATVTDPIPAGTGVLAISNGGSVAHGVATWPIASLAAGASGTRTLVVAPSQPVGSTVTNSGASFSGRNAAAALGTTALTTIVAPPLVLDGSLALSAAEVIVPDVVRQTGTFAYLSGGYGVLENLTAVLTTTNDRNGVVATHNETLTVLLGATSTVTFDWNTDAISSGTYSVTFDVIDAAGVPLLSRSASVIVRAHDGANLSGTIAPLDSPVHLGATLDTGITLTNRNGVEYSALRVEIIVADPATLEPLVTVPADVAIGANGDATATIDVPTASLAIGQYPLWLTTPLGGGRLLATSELTVIPPQLTLEPSAITIAAGATGTLTAQLSSPAPAPLTLTLTSSTPSIVSVPATISIPAGATTQTIAVEGVDAGGPATITAALPAALGGDSATSSVLVVLDGALTATLQVYQGENVSFGVTIVNGGQSALNAAPFVIEIRNPATNTVVEVIRLTVTVAAGATFQTTATHDTSALAFQKYTAHLVYTAPVPAQTIATAEFEVLEPPPVRLDAVVGTSVRVLIWANCSPDNSGKPCTPVPPPFLVQTLQTAGIPYVVSGEENDFLAKLRTGGFTAAVIDQAGAAEPKIAPELLASIHARIGLLFIHSQPNAMPKLAPALGTEFQGKLHGPATLQLRATPFTAPATLTLKGNGTRIALAGAKVAATIAGSDTPAISYNEYGEGRVVVVPFDLEQTPALDVARLILSSIGWLSRPAEAPFDAREVVPVRVTVITPPGGDLPVVVSITLPDTMSAVDAAPPLTSTSPMQWSATLPGNTTATFDLWVRLPDAAGTFTETVAASLPGGPPIATRSVTFEVTGSATAMASALNAELATLRAAARSNPDVKALDDSMAQLARLDSDAVANIARVLRILDNLTRVSLDTGPARAAAAPLLMYWQTKAGV